MSELKAKHVVDVYEAYAKTGDDYAAQVYHKSEADKVIEEKDKVIAELKRACNDKDDWCLHTLKENHHQKYKRCLAMAKWCNDRYILDDCLYELGKTRFYERWEKRWLAIAEKFKEAK